jgi:hypothetical protein
MRLLSPATPILAIALGAVSAPAFAQADRYGGVNTYGPTMAQQQPARVLSWPGKTIPAPPQPPQNHQANYTGQPAYGAQLRPPPYQQAPGAPPAPYAVQRNAAQYPPAAYAPPVAYYPYPQYRTQPGAQPQPYPTQSLPPQAAYPAQQPYAQPYQAQRPGQAQAYPAQPGQPQLYSGQPLTPEQMAAAMPPPINRNGNTATAPSGVYPAMPGYPQPGVPIPGLPASAYPPAPFPQGPIPAPPVPAPPASIYAPMPQADAGRPDEEPQPQMVAMASPTARVYSLHRDFGLAPERPVASPADSGGMVELAVPPPQPRQEAQATDSLGLRALASLGDDN